MTFITSDMAIAALDREQAAQLQTLLNEKGFDAGKVDGIMGPKTYKAWGNFKRSQNLGQLDRIGPASLKTLQDLSVNPGLLTWVQAATIFPRITEFQFTELNRCLKQFDINTVPRQCHFLSQCGHESGGLKYVKEIDKGWYIPKKFNLPAIAASDGAYKYRGSGVIQLSMPDNYRAFSKFMGDPKIYDKGCPYVAANYPFSSAGFWWLNNNMNALCDRGATVEQITRRVNGGLNGLADRQSWYSRISNVLT